MDRFHLTLPEIAGLTDRVIDEVYFHARTKEGRIDLPAPAVEAAAEPETEAGTVAQLDLLRQLNLITPENHAECVAAARRKFGNGDAGPT